MSRPRKHDRRRLMVAVCERIAGGELVKDAAIAEGVDPRRIREWALDNELAPLYARAREQQAHAFAEQAIAAASGIDDFAEAVEKAIDAEDDALAATANPQRHQIINALQSNAINRDRLRVDTLKWIASKLAPKSYGDKQQVEHSAKDGAPIPFTFRIDSPSGDSSS